MMGTDEASVSPVGGVASVQLWLITFQGYKPYVATTSGFQRNWISALARKSNFS